MGCLEKYKMEFKVDKKNNGMIAISISNKKLNQQREGTIFCSMDGIVNKEQISKICMENKSIYFDENLCCPLGQFNKL